MKNPFDAIITRNEQKILGFLAVFTIIGIILYNSGISKIYADRKDPDNLNLAEAVKQDSIFRIDIRMAEAEEMILLPGIGEKRAADIIAYRQNKQFESTEELLNIKGIGIKTFLKMKPMLLAFGTAGAGVSSTAKLNELNSAETSSEDGPAASGKQELDETDNINIKEHSKQKSVSDDKLTLIRLNTATKQDLISLDGIGEVKAEAILAYRRQIGKFTSVEQLLDVKGIGPKTLEKNRSRLSL